MYNHVLLQCHVSKFYQILLHLLCIISSSQFVKARSALETRLPVQRVRLVTNAMQTEQEKKSVLLAPTPLLALMRAQLAHKEPTAQVQGALNAPSARLDMNATAIERVRRSVLLAPILKLGRIPV